MTERLRPTWVEVDLGAVRSNVAALAALAQPAQLMAVVKADGYGHGAVPVARAALEAGATWLGVALVEEGVELRDAGIDAPVLVLSEPPPGAFDVVVARGLTPVVYGEGAVDALAKAVARAGCTDPPFAVHLKVDTGMRRVGCEPSDAVALARHVAECSGLRLEGVCTHLAVADEPDNPFTDEQLTRFDAILAELDGHGVWPEIVHAANSPALLGFERSRYDLVRAGIAVYGIRPGPETPCPVALRPALALKARVAHVKRISPGERVSYGLRYAAARDTTIATVPVGYADGVPRALGHHGGEVLVHGGRHAIAGTITMDQLMVDCGDTPVAVGDEVVLIGRQGDAEVTAAEWAERLDTIAYEVVSGIGARVPRVYV